MTTPAPPPLDVRLPWDGVERRYLLYRPPSLGPAAALVVVLHGRGIDPAAFDRWTGFSVLAAEEGFALALPAARGEVWNDGRFEGRRWQGVERVDDVGFLSAVVDDVLARIPVDPRRVALVGMSNGATMTARLVLAHADRFAALAQVAGTAAAALLPGARPASSVPVLQIHGTGDRMSPYEGGPARGILTRGLLHGAAGPSTGVDAWARFWVEVNSADPEPRVEELGPDVRVRAWRGSTPRSDIRFYRVDGGGHTWPGTRTWVPPFFGPMSRTIDATREIWAFIAEHARRE